MSELYSILIQHKEGRELLDEVPRTPKERADALTKAGIALVEAGRYEEAKDCFAKAKDLESGQLPKQNPERMTYESKKEKIGIPNEIHKKDDDDDNDLVEEFVLG